MENIKIGGLKFELLIPQDQILKQITTLANKLQKKYGDSFPFCLIVLNGASIFASRLLGELDSSVQFGFVKVRSYDGLHSMEEILIDYFPYDLIKNNNILLIEDIVDTGLTMNFLIKELKKNGAKKVECVTLLFKPGKYQYSDIPDYIGFDIEDDFVVGYGMDYNEKGRNLSSIYKRIIH